MAHYLGKYHVSTALRTAAETHVPEILRDAGPKVTLYPIALQPLLTFYYVGKTHHGNC